MPKYYEIAGGRLWDVDAARFVGQAPDGAEIISLYADGKPAGEDYLRRTLAFYGYPVGPELLTLEELKAAKLAQINEGCQSALAALTPTYPEKELLTFERQEREARALLAGDGSDVVHITAIASGRGIPVEELARKIAAKADAFSLASGLLIGQRQRYEDLLEGAQTKEAVAAIQPVYTLPEVQA
ncbi:hypothetical protein [Desulfovibrio piger]|uniref:hypothetical protein n=1 Tax=Desulfovibrio piger TaxID=901 RepID=UPI00242B568C|nr:hypothetical protein [Desulfovibrio piger]MCI7506821.1 hypothetical protein [Desulfovibrio piger]